MRFDLPGGSIVFVGLPEAGEETGETVKYVGDEGSFSPSDPMISPSSGSLSLFISTEHKSMHEGEGDIFFECDLFLIRDMLFLGLTEDVVILTE